MPMSDKIKILLVDDHQTIKDGIRAILKDVETIEVAAEASNGEEAITLLKDNPYDMVLMDINMPKVDGIEATTFINKNFNDVKVLALTMHDDDEYILKMLQAGALGYILKTTGQQELVDAIKTVAKGESYFTQEVSSVLLGQFVKKKKTAEKKKYKEVPLTSREKEILKLIAEEYTNQEIADKLFISPRTVDTHRRNLLLKLEVKNTAGLVRYAFKSGLIEG